MLTARSAAVLADVLNGPGPVRVGDLSTRYEVSERTVKHDIQQVRDWLQERGIELQMTATDGFHLDCAARRRTALLEEAYGTGTEQTSEDRAVAIAGLLVRTTTATSINALAEELGVARNTVLSDLTLVERLLRDAGIHLRRDRAGLAVEDPIHVRRAALVQIIRISLREEDVVHCTRMIAAASCRRASQLLQVLDDLVEAVDDADPLAADVRRLALRVSETYGVTISDAAVVGLFLRMLAVVAIPSAEPASSAEGASADLLRSLDVREGVVRWTRTAADVDFVLFELGLRISSERLRGTETHAQSFDVGLIARTLIADVDRTLGLSLTRDGSLLPSLIAHLSDRLVTVHHGILESSPVLDDVIDQYPEIHETVRAATRRIFAPAGLTLDETDCAFLTVHFATALQRHQERPRYRTLLVCGTGRGTTELLRSFVETQLPEIDVIAQCSVFSAGAVSTRPDIDLVVSTFPFTTEKPLAVVRSIPTGEDLEIIAARIADVDAAQTNPAPTERRRSHSAARSGRSYEEMILHGFELTRALCTTLDRELTGELLDGLRMHCLFLAKRIANKELYTSEFDGTSAPSALERRIDDVCRAHEVILPRAELAAIAVYFGKGNRA